MAILDDLRQYAASQRQDPMAMLAMMKLMSSPQAQQQVQRPVQLAGNYLTPGGLIMTPREQQQLESNISGQAPQVPPTQPAQPAKYVNPAEERSYLQQRMEEDKARLKELSKQTQKPKRTYYGD